MPAGLAPAWTEWWGGIGHYKHWPKKSSHGIAAEHRGEDIFKSRKYCIRWSDTREYWQCHEKLDREVSVFFPGLGKSQKIPVLAIQLIPSRDIIDKKIQQSDWTGGTPGHIQQRVVVSDATFPCWLAFNAKKSLNISIDSFQKNWWPKNPATWSDKSHN